MIIITVTTIKNIVMTFTVTITIIKPVLPMKIIVETIKIQMETNVKIKTRIVIIIVKCSNEFCDSLNGIITAVYMHHYFRHCMAVIHSACEGLHFSSAGISFAFMASFISCRKNLGVLRGHLFRNSQSDLLLRHVDYLELNCKCCTEHKRRNFFFNLCQIYDIKLS